MQSASARSRSEKGAEEVGLTPEEMKGKHDIGLSRGGKNTKIHALVDDSLDYTGGEVHDSKECIPLLEGFELAGSAVLGDKAFGTATLLGNATIITIKSVMS